jgi:hypothetical protein
VRVWLPLYIPFEAVTNTSNGLDTELPEGIVPEIKPVDWFILNPGGKFSALYVNGL